jgi:hypothetical protein
MPLRRRAEQRRSRREGYGPGVAALGSGVRLPFADRADAGRRLGDRLAALLDPRDPAGVVVLQSLLHITEPTRRTPIA